LPPDFPQYYHAIFLPNKEGNLSFFNNLDRIGI
jgi:hypothetical protein